MTKNKNIPDIRFRGFTDEWENSKLGALANFAKGQGYSKGDLVEDGTPIVLYGRLYTNYQTVISDVNTKAVDKKGSIYSTGIEVVVPASGETAEDIARASAIAKKDILLGGDLNIIYPSNKIKSIFLALNISNGKEQKELIKRAQGKSVVHIRNSDLKEVYLFYPNKKEQTKIGNYFKNLDQLITQHQQKQDKLLTIKKAMLKKMFPQNGADAPEIRFKGFTENWEIKKFGDCALIQRGGSPRPIEEYITNDKNGINWIKIGDVGIGSRYITKTKEKIIPEGVKHSRRVQKGDLILSNSMSFGRPYIMAIDGCIHDGWLLIRDEKEMFNLEFLLQLLSSDYMLNQYKALASGGVVINLNSGLVQSTNVFIPKKEEQAKIGNFFKDFDNIISLNKQKLEKLNNIKKAFLDKMFV